MAEIVLRAMLAADGLDSVVSVTSAGTGDWHIGECADPRTIDVLQRNGYDASRHRARQFEAATFDDCDLVVGMDAANVAALRRMAPPGRADEIRLLRSFDPDATGTDVPDPYYGGPEGFDDALAMVEASCRGLVDWLHEATLDA